MRTLLLALSLTWPLARRDIAARYRGSVGGLLWTLMGPLVMVGIYSVVFQGVFQARWPGAESTASGGVAYALRLFSGLVVFSGFTEVATRATRLIQDNASLVKRVVFPMELLCLSLVLQVSVHMALQFVLLGLLAGVAGEGLKLSMLSLILIFPWIFCLLTSVALVMSCLGCYLRDLQHLVPLSMSALLFLSPVFYPADAAPEVLKFFLQLNPMTGPIEAVRAASFGMSIDLRSMSAQVLLAVVILLGSLLLFRRLRSGFADLV